MNYKVGDKIISKKLHPCGSNSWEIIRTGCDIKLKCLGCGHIVCIDVSKFDSIVKRHIPRQD